MFVSRCVSALVVPDVRNVPADTALMMALMRASLESMLK